MKSRKKSVTALFVVMAVCIMQFMISASAVYAATTESPKVTMKAPEYDITISIIPANGWQKDNSKVNIHVYDNKNTGTFRVKKIEAKTGIDDAWKDITDSRYIEVSENCNVYVQVTDAYGSTYTKSRYISNYDKTPPTFNCAVSNGVLTVQTHDSESGAEFVYINGYKFNVKDDKLTVRLSKFDASYQNFNIYAVDANGNESEAQVIDNPYFQQQSSSEDEESDGETANPADDLPDSVEPNQPGESSATITSITNENGKDISKKVKGKQFYSIVSKDGQQFYIIIDTTMDSSEAEGAASSDGTVYFLTNVGNSDLLNLTGDGEVTLPHNSVAAENGIAEDMPEDIEEAEVSAEEGEDSEKAEEKEEKESEGGSSTLVIIIIVAVIMAVVVLVKLKGGKGNSVTSDDELYAEDYEEEEVSLDELNESEEGESE